MLITSYGLDSAILQIVYYYTTNRTDWITMSGRNLKDYLEVNNVNMIAGLSEHIPEAYLANNPNVFVIDNRKSVISKYEYYNRFFYEEKKSKASIFLSYFKQILKHCNYLVDIADAMSAWETNDQTIEMENLYNSLGHNIFVQRFIYNESPDLNKTERKLIDFTIQHREQMAKDIVKSAYCEDGILICNADFQMQPFIANEYFGDGNEDKKLLICYSFSVEGQLSIALKSPSQLAGDFAKSIGSSGWGNNGYIKLDVDFSKIKDYTQFIVDRYISKILSFIETGGIQKFDYDKIQDELEGIPTIDDEEDDFDDTESNNNSADLESSNIGVNLESDLDMNSLLGLIEDDPDFKAIMNLKLDNEDDI